MDRKIVRCFVLFAAWTSVHAAEPTAALSIPIGGYGHYVLLPVSTTELKLPRGELRNISDRMLGRMAPLLNEWNYSEKAAKLDAELAISLVVDKSKGASGSSRAMWGALAGDSDVVAHVDLIERPSGNLIGRQAFFVSTKAAWNASGTVSDYLMYDELVSQVVSYLSSCYSIQSKSAAVDPIKP